ncbi:SRF-type transcription factor domain-containing protein [Hirsutella rhossiliensis]
MASKKQILPIRDLRRVRKNQASRFSKRRKNFIKKAYKLHEDCDVDVFLCVRSKRNNQIWQYSSGLTPPSQAEIEQSQINDFNKEATKELTVDDISILYQKKNENNVNYLGSLGSESFERNDSARRTTLLRTPALRTLDSKSKNVLFCNILQYRIFSISNDTRNSDMTTILSPCDGRTQTSHALLDPELQYGHGDNDALYNLYFSSLPKPHDNHGVDERILGQLFSPWRRQAVINPVIPGPDMLERARLREQMKSKDTENYITSVAHFAQEQAKFDTKLALELAKHCQRIAFSTRRHRPYHPESRRNMNNGMAFPIQSLAVKVHLPLSKPLIPDIAALSVDALQFQVNEFAKENGFGCDRYGEPPPSRSAGLRQKRSNKCGCKRKVIAEALKRIDYMWTLRALHSYDRRMNLLAHLVHQGLIESVKDTVEVTSRRVGIRARDIRGIIREYHPGMLYTRKDTRPLPTRTGTTASLAIDDRAWYVWVSTLASLPVTRCAASFALNPSAKSSVLAGIHIILTETPFAWRRLTGLAIAYNADRPTLRTSYISNLVDCPVTGRLEGQFLQVLSVLFSAAKAWSVAFLPVAIANLIAALTACLSDVQLLR